MFQIYRPVAANHLSYIRLLDIQLRPLSRAAVHFPAGLGQFRRLAEAQLFSGGGGGGGSLKNDDDFFFLYSEFKVNEQSLYRHC